jgi:hypothetical protein
MRFVPTAVHGVIDYVWAAALIGSPWVLGFGSSWGDAMVPVGVGLFVMFYSFFTAYEWGMFGVLTMRAHLWTDLGTGLFLAASPWLFGFARVVWVPHVLFGLFAVVAALVTRTVPRSAAAPPEPFPA